MNHFIFDGPFQDGVKGTCILPDGRKIPIKIYKGSTGYFLNIEPSGYNSILWKSFIPDKETFLKKVGFKSLSGDFPEFPDLESLRKAIAVLETSQSGQSSTCQFKRHRHCLKLNFHL